MSDPLNLLRSAIGATQLPFLTTSSDPSTAEEQQTESLVLATHLSFSLPTPLSLPLNSPTRFVSNTHAGKDIDLRSIWFAWVNKDATVPESITNVTELNKQLSEEQKVLHLSYVERLSLLSWLEGAEESEYIKPLEGAAAEASNAADVAGGAGVPTVSGSGMGVTQQTAGGRPIKVIDARLQTIYKGERKMGDHNTVLRGIKPTDFSHVRKHHELFLGRRPQKSQSKPQQSSTQLTSRPLPQPSKPLNSAVSSKRSDPIILLSPSASSLLRMSNIKTFLDTGLYVPFDHPTLASSTSSNLLHLTRPMRSLSERPYRFIIVDSPEQFKPDYWARVVAVFTTGQTWQFRGYKWTQPQELFSHVLGVYVGEKGAPVPSEVKGWGNGVRRFEVERWDERGHGGGVDHETRVGRRWRDRETVEEVWRAVELWMRGRGEWKR